MSAKVKPRPSLKEQLGKKRRRQNTVLVYAIGTTSMILCAYMLIVCSFGIFNEIPMLLIMLFLSWGLVGMASTLLRQISEVGSAHIFGLDMRKTIIIGTPIMFVVIRALLIFELYSNNFQPVLIGSTLLFEIFSFVSFSSIGAIPSNKTSIWLASVCGLIIFVIDILMPIESSLSASGLTVEILGAFIGVLAAISLGEIFKDINEFQNGSKLKILIFDELQEIEEKLEQGITDQIPIPVWTAALGDGSILKLPSDFRRKVTKAHTAIHYSNLNNHTTKYRQEALKSISQVE